MTTQHLFANYLSNYAHADAALRTVIDTERLTGLSPYHAIRNTIAA